MSTVDQNPPIQPSVVTTTAFVQPQRPVGQSGKVPKQLMSTVSRSVANNVGKKSLANFDGNGQLYIGKPRASIFQYDSSGSLSGGRLDEHGRPIFPKPIQTSPQEKKEQLFFKDNAGNWYRVEGQLLTPPFCQSSCRLS